MSPAADTHEAGDRIARRNAVVLALAGALGSSGGPLVFATAGLVGTQLAPDPALATAPVTAFVAGMALGTVPAALLTRRFGRRAGFMLGTLLGIGASLLSALGIWSGLFVVFCAGTLLAGCYASFVQQFRFAAADTASEAFRPKAISWVLAGGVLAGVIGPQTVIRTAELMPPFTFLASYLAFAGLLVGSVALLSQLALPPRAGAAVAAPAGRPWGEILANPRLRVAVLCAVSAYVLMNFVMTSSPLAMVACGHSVADATLGIQWHVIAMFGPSFFTGGLIARFGVERVIAAGFVLMTASAIIGLSGLGLAQFWTALILLGLGWNLSFVGATAMLTGCYRPEERSRVQAGNDLAVFTAVALGSLSSGAVLTNAGWEFINLLIFPVSAACLAALLWLSLRTRPSPATA